MARTEIPIEHNSMNSVLGDDSKYESTLKRMKKGKTEEGMDKLLNNQKMIENDKKMENQEKELEKQNQVLESQGFEISRMVQKEKEKESQDPNIKLNGNKFTKEQIQSWQEEHGDQQNKDKEQKKDKEKENKEQKKEKKNIDQQTKDDKVEVDIQLHGNKFT